MMGILFVCILASVTDVDTVKCQDGTKIRLWAVNGVEAGEPGYREARLYLKGLLPVGTELICEYKGDNGGRVVALCNKRGLDLGEAVVSSGYASACPAFSDRYVKFERPDRPAPASFCIPKE